MRRRLLILGLIFTILISAYSEYAVAAFGGEGAFGSVINFLKVCATSIIPSADNTYDLGSSSKTWRTIYAGTSSISNLTVTENTYLATSSGNVGIGLTNPNAKLSIQGAGTGIAFSLKIQDNTGVNKFTVLDNGNVGIGTTEPGAKLDIYQSGVNQTQLQVLRDNVNTSSPAVKIWDASWSNAGTNPIFTIQSDIASGNSTYINVLKNGNVGIGTTAPAANLHVLNSAAASATGQEVLRLSANHAAGTVGSGGIIQFVEATTQGPFIRSYTT